MSGPKGRGGSLLGGHDLGRESDDLLVGVGRILTAEELGARRSLHNTVQVVIAVQSDLEIAKRSE